MKAVPDKLALYNALVATIPAVQRKGATVPYVRTLKPKATKG